MIFADLDLSRCLERAEAQAGKEFAEARARLYPESGSASIEHAGAIAIFDGTDSPVTQTFCLGLFEDLPPRLSTPSSASSSTVVPQLSTRSARSLERLPPISSARGATDP